MRKQCFITAAAIMMAVGAICGAGEKESQAATVAISKKNFPDKVFRELVKVNYDKNKDGKLSAKEIKKAKKFGSSSCKNKVKIKPSKYAKYQKKYVKDIKSFKGVGKLTALRKFVANGTSVKTVNFKKNKNLIYLEMTDGKLQKLDLNKNKKLKYLYLEYNQLTSLKINKCKKLVDVDLTGHMVKKLKIFHNKKTKVQGEEYYKPYNATKINASILSPSGGALDVNGNYCIYEWNEDYSACVKKTLNGTSLDSVAINLNADTLKKTKEMQNITAQWQDAKGNFYFVADKDGDMLVKTVNYLYKVNAGGAIEKEIVLNDQIDFSENYNNRYNLYFMNQSGDVAALKMTTGNSDIFGILYFDMNLMKVTKQVECSFEPYATEGTTVVGSTAQYEAVVSKIPEGEVTELENGGMVEVCTLAASHRISILDAMRPGDIDESIKPYSLQIKNNYVYLITNKGFFKAKLTAKSFTQLYGIGKIPGIQSLESSYCMTIKSEKEIVLLFADKGEEKVSYRLLQCSV